MEIFEHDGATRADARADFLAAIQANPADVEPHYFLGVLYQHLGDWNHAEAELAKAVAISPRYMRGCRRGADSEAVRESAASTSAIKIWDNG